MGPEIHLAHLVGKLTVNQTAFVLAEIVDTSLVVVAIRVFFAPTFKKNEKLSVAIKNLSMKVYTFETFGSWNGDEWASSFPVDVLCLT